MSAVHRRQPFYLGIDLGGTNIKSGVVDDLGRPLSSVSLETEAERGPEVGISNLAQAGKQAVVESGLSWDDITGVGLGSPGTMDLSRGMLLEPPNLPGWNQLADPGPAGPEAGQADGASERRERRRLR